MSRKLYLECYAGISGDMAAAALLDLGADEQVLRKALQSLRLDGWTLEISRVKKSGLDVCDFAVKLDAAHENHDHNMEYLHGTEDVHTQEHAHTAGHTHAQVPTPIAEHTHPQAQDSALLAEHEHPQDSALPAGHAHPQESPLLAEHAHVRDSEADPDILHDYSHVHSHVHTAGHDHASEHEHVHRGLPEIRKIIGRSELTPGAKSRAIRIFEILTEAEAKAHGVPREEVHFHEVGAVDSIVDIAAVSVCLDNLGIEEVIIPVLYEGRGWIRCQHGIIPVPVPATLNIAQAYGLRLHQTDTEGEFVTPTGAAVAAAIRTTDILPDQYTVLRVGLGAGKRQYERPSILRAMLIEECGAPENAREWNDDTPEEIFKLETNVDDCSGETLGHAMDELLKAGALEVNYTPVFMKKNRPAYLITVLCRIADRERMEKILFSETTAIGVRRQRMERTILKRRQRILPTTLGDVEVKELYLPEGRIRYAPEYQSVAALAQQHRLPYPQTLRIIEAQLAQQEGSREKE